MLLLPTFNARLNLCSISVAADFTVHEKGHFCGHCQCVVQDFSRSENPAADLAAARAASPDGRVCGSFRREQVVVPPLLTRRLKWFLLALVLVVGQGLTAREALAQVRKATPSQHTTMAKKQVIKPQPVQLAGDTVALPAKPHLVTTVEPDLQELKPANEEPEAFLGTVVEQMPTFRGGGLTKVIEYINRQVVWPQTNGQLIQAEGRVFVSFIVDAQGQVRDAKVVRGFQPLFDAAVLDAVRSLDGFKPAKSNGKPVSMGMTVPIDFKLKK